MEQGMTIGEVSGKLGMTSHTLRYYERAGLMRSVPRTEGGLRRYQDEDVQILRFLSKLRLTGMPIQQIRRYAELMRSGNDTVEERRALLLEHRENVVRNIKELQRNLAILDVKIEMYERGTLSSGSEDPCAIKLRELLEEKV